MKTFKEFRSNSLCEMSNLYPNKTGLGVVIWISPKYGSKGKLRIKVGDNLKEVLYDMNTHLSDWSGAKEYVSRYKDKVDDWVISNFDILLKHWNKEYDGADVVLALKSAGAIK